MYDTINFNTFNDWFIKHRPNNFSYDGREALFDHLEQYGSDQPNGIEFDPIALCCSYTEYDNIQTFWQDYSQEDYPTMEKIEDNTTVIPFSENSFIIIQF